MAYDSLRDRTYVISGLGFNNQPPFNLFRYDDIWAWDGEEWSEVITTLRPAPRQGSRAVFDEARGELVLFGGRCLGGSDCNDTWTFDGTSWTRRLPSTVPVVREGHTLIYDALRSRVVLFGGSSDPFTFLNDTWEWDGIDWREVRTASAPSPRSGAAGAFDPERGLIVTYGGANRDQVYSDTWTFDGSTWKELLIPTLPRRQEAEMVFRPGDGVVLFGGLDNTVADARIDYSETWRLGAGDFTAPSVNCPTAPVFLINAKNPVLSAHVQDEPGGSGPLTDVVSTLADVLTVGRKVSQLMASDRAAHSTTVTCQYRVEYAFKGFEAPVVGGGTLNDVVAGREINFKWGLFDYFGAPITNLPMVRLSVASIPCTLGVTADMPPRHSELRNLGGGFYKISLATERSYSRSCKVVRFDFGEGATRDAYFQFVK